VKTPVVVIGIGEMGGVFARALLRHGHPVFPVTRGADLPALAQEIPAPALVLAAVAESDLHAVLTALPQAWRARIALLQNELLPRDWEAFGLTDPTVISVWFEKKKGQDTKVIIPSPGHGPQAGLLVAALAELEIPAREVDSAEAMLRELVIKNAYILTSNICGLVVDGDVGTLWESHRELAEAVLAEVLDIQEWLVGHPLDRAAVASGMVHAFAGDPEHKCRGRSAPARLERALAQADEAGLPVPQLRAIEDRLESG
jgi:ketopantoate reductase